MDKKTKKDVLDSIVDVVIAKAKESDDGIEDISETIADYVEGSPEFQSRLLDKAFSEPEIKKNVMKDVTDELLG